MIEKYYEDKQNIIFSVISIYNFSVFILKSHTHNFRKIHINTYCIHLTLKSKYFAVNTELPEKFQSKIYTVDRKKQ